MLAKEADNLKVGDSVLTKNGVYTQKGTVQSVEKDHRGVRWIAYSWITKGKKLHGLKRHNSVYLPTKIR